jgi:hypothetical protein
MYVRPVYTERWQMLLLHSSADGASYYFYTDVPARWEHGCPNTTTVEWKCQAPDHYGEGSNCLHGQEPWFNFTHGTGVGELSVKGRCGSFFEHFHPVGTEVPYDLQTKKESPPPSLSTAASGGNQTLLLQWAPEKSDRRRCHDHGGECKMCEEQEPRQCRRARNCLLVHELQQGSCHDDGVRGGGIHLDGTLVNDETPDEGLEKGIEAGGCTYKPVCTDNVTDVYCRGAEIVPFLRRTPMHSVAGLDYDTEMSHVSVVSDDAGGDECGGYGYGYGDSGGGDACSASKSVYDASKPPPDQSSQTLLLLLRFHESDVKRQMLKSGNSASLGGCGPVSSAAEASWVLCNYTKVEHAKTVKGGLGFNPCDYADLQALGSACMLLACWVYGAYLTDVPLRKIVVVMHLALAATSFFDTSLALGFHQTLGIPTWMFAMFDISSYWFAIEFKMLPIYALAYRIAPGSVEATMIALVYTMKDLANAMCALYGAALTSW